MNENKLVVYKRLDKIMEDNLYPSSTILYQLAKQKDSSITMKQIKDYINSQEAYQITKERHLTTNSMGHVVSFSLWGTIQIDLIDMSKFSFEYSQCK